MEIFRLTTYEFTVVLERDEDGVYIASTPALTGCHSWGDTREEALENIKEAIELHLESRLERGEPIRSDLSVERVFVAV